MTTIPDTRETVTHTLIQLADIESDLRQLAEDTYLLASCIHTGNDELLIDPDTTFAHPDDRAAHTHWRTIELLVSIGDRICATLGQDPLTNDIQVPDDITHLVG